MQLLHVVWDLPAGRHSLLKLHISPAFSSEARVWPSPCKVVSTRVVRKVFDLEPMRDGGSQTVPRGRLYSGPASDIHCRCPKPGVKIILGESMSIFGLSEPEVHTPEC